MKRLAIIPIIVMWAMSAFGDVDLADYVVIPGEQSEAIDLLKGLAENADLQQQIQPQDARQQGLDYIQGNCDRSKVDCISATISRQKIKRPEQALGRLDPLIKEYLILDTAVSGEDSCTQIATRQRDPIWQEQSCRRDEDFKLINALLSASDIYTNIDSQNNSVVAEVGTAGDNYWSNNVYDRMISIDLPSPHAFLSFDIIRLNYDDYLRIKVNNQQVFNGPFGGDRLDYFSYNKVCYSATRCSPSDYGISWQHNQKINILPFLRAGKNIIDTRTVVGGGGEFRMLLQGVYNLNFIEATKQAAYLQKCSDLTSLGCEYSRTGNCLYQDHGSCVIHTQIYSCPQKAPTHAVVGCSMPDICTGEHCKSSEQVKSNNDFGEVIAKLELARQSATYIDQDSLVVFQGSQATCRDKIAWGTVDCCRSEAGGNEQNNYAVLASLGAQLLVRGAPANGSKYVFDTFFTNDLSSSLETLGSSLASLDVGAIANSFSYYGIEVKLSAGSLNFGFDPVSFSTAIALAVIADLLSCSSDEQLFALRNGAGLCNKYRERCSGLGCRTEYEYHCCYNSVLAKLVATNGWSQLNNTYHQGDKCPGFSINQLEQIDFSKIDLSEFIAKIKPDASQPKQTIYKSETNQALQESIKRGIATVEN